jgi:hypothetical protein
MPTTTCELKRPPLPGARESRRSVITRTMTRAWRNVRPRSPRLALFVLPLLVMAQLWIERDVLATRAASWSVDVLGLGLSGSLLLSGLLVVLAVWLLRHGPPVRLPLRLLVTLPALGWGLLNAALVLHRILTA